MSTHPTKPINSSKSERNTQVVLIVLDGWGYREDSEHNAIAQARTPFFDSLWKKYPHTLLEASGLAVGLPEGQMGNSEIGHTTIGAGKVIDTDLVRIGKAIETGEYAKNSAFVSLFDHVKKHSSTLHVQGLLSDGGVHSHYQHLFAFLNAAKAAGIKRVAVHAFTDGRDTAPQSAAHYLKDLEKVLAEVGIGFIATVSGRFYAMDRDNNWDRLAKVEQALFECKGNLCTLKPSEYVENLYKEGKLDEHLEPIVCLDANGKGCAVEDNDAVFFFNFRADRARMISTKVLERQMKNNVCFATLTEYSTEFKCLVAFPPAKIETTLAAEISKAGLTQAHIAETEKFPHATYFLNGGKEKPHEGEVHVMLSSRKDVQTHDLAPKMQAAGIADKAIEQINAGTDFIFINFANPDMVGHTANIPAIIEAVEEVDLQLKRVAEALSAQGGIAFITADHGNAEVNVDPVTGEKHTAHTINPVPAVITDTSLILRDGGGLADIAPTILKLMDIDQPASMTGKSIVV
jgi:2,3-bisphosphoglycerate-independent phosphoglycerate mutase